MEDIELGGERETKKRQAARMLDGGVRRSMKRKGLREEDAMDRDFWRQQIVLC